MGYVIFVKNRGKAQKWRPSITSKIFETLEEAQHEVNLRHISAFRDGTTLSYKIKEGEQENEQNDKIKED